MKKMIVPMMLMMSLGAFAQAERGNGGISYVCRDGKNQITYARLLDLWEPETFRTNEDFSTSADEQFNRVAERILRLDEVVGKEIIRVDKVLKDRTAMTFKPLPLTNDAIPDYSSEAGCSFEQVARYGFTNELNKDALRIHKEIYDSQFFSNTDRAALRLHEILYFIDARLNKAQTSQKTRRLVSRLFSDADLTDGQKIELVELVDPTTRSYFEKLDYLIETSSSLTAISELQFSIEKMYIRSSELDLQIKGTFDLKCLSGKAEASYEFSKVKSRVVTVLAKSEANARNAAITVFNKNYVIPFVDQKVTIKAGDIYSFHLKSSYTSSCGPKNPLKLVISDDEGKRYGSTFMELSKRGKLVRIIDITK